MTDPFDGMGNFLRDRKSGQEGKSGQNLTGVWGMVDIAQAMLMIEQGEDFGPETDEELRMQELFMEDERRMLDNQERRKSSERLNVTKLRDRSYEEFFAKEKIVVRQLRVE